MEVTLEVHYQIHCKATRGVVSILILMEVTLEDPAYLSHSAPLIGFNPYSNGSYSGRAESLRFSFQVSQVSILILMEVTLEGTCKEKSNRFAQKFQSLF